MKKPHSKPTDAQPATIRMVAKRVRGRAVRVRTSVNAGLIQKFEGGDIEGC